MTENSTTTADILAQDPTKDDMAKETDIKKLVEEWLARSQEPATGLEAELESAQKKIKLL